jgi:hypothetical protein
MVRIKFFKNKRPEVIFLVIGYIHDGYPTKSDTCYYYIYIMVYFKAKLELIFTQESILNFSKL